MDGVRCVDALYLSCLIYMLVFCARACAPLPNLGSNNYWTHYANHINNGENVVVHKSEETEQVSELFHKVNIDRDGSSRQQPTTALRFLDYTPVRIFDPFFASRLNNWRAIRLHIHKSNTGADVGLFDGSRFICAVDLCRTHAALESERNFLGAEKSVGLYLAGVVFGGPDMYDVRTTLLFN